MRLRWHWTPRRVEAIGLGCIAVGLGLIYMPAGLMAGGLLLVVGGEREDDRREIAW